MDPAIEKALKTIADDPKKNISVLTGAGISAESGIPTFRGPEGYWTVGAREYQPQEMATFDMFSQNPYAVWEWYLYRLAVCSKAEPNPGHMAVVDLEKAFGDRFALITQNVDNLHLRAGNTPGRMYQIHGNIAFMRCTRGCVETLFPVPESLSGWTRNRSLTESEKKHLVCPECGAMSRPHVLWFDEVYDEIHFRLRSTLQVADRTDLLIVVGTSGTTNLPNKVAFNVSRRLKTIILDINPEFNPFAALASKTGGFSVQETGGRFLPELVRAMTEGRG